MPSRLSKPGSTAHAVLVVVCVLHGLSPYLLRGLHPGYGWDETVYISQINPHVVAGFFSAPRARGLTLLTAPIALLTASVGAMRLWLALLSGLGLYLGFVPWLRVRAGFVAPVAALLWSGLWLSIYYSYEAMPNEYIAYAALASCGWLLLAIREPSRRQPLGYLAVALAVAALIRPSDSVAIAVPLLVVVAASRTLTARRGALFAAVMVAGLAAGWVEWVVEAFVSFGGPIARLKAASVENGGAGLHWVLGTQLRTLGGPLLCRANCQASASFGDVVWWLLLPALTAVGLIAARRCGVVRIHVVACAVAIALAAEYLILLDYSAPRFLLPAYALLAVPIAEAVCWVVSIRVDRWRVAVIAGLIAAFAAQEVTQASIVASVSSSASHESARSEALGMFLRQHGVRGDCAVAGLDAGPTSFDIGCFGVDTLNWKPMVKQLATPRDVAIAVVRRAPAPHHAFYRDWRTATFHPDPGITWQVWLSVPGSGTYRP